MGKYYPCDIVGDVMLEGIKFFVPVPEKPTPKQRDVQRSIPWVFSKASNENLAKISLMTTAMGKSKSAAMREKAVADAIAALHKVKNTEAAKTFNAALKALQTDGIATTTARAAVFNCDGGHCKQCSWLHAA